MIRGTSFAATLLLSLISIPHSAASLDLAEWDSARWSVTVDGVMGGRSTGNMNKIAEGMAFSGDINIKGGGFASIERSMPSVNLAEYIGIWVEVDALASDVASGNVMEAPQGVTLQFRDNVRILSFGETCYGL